MKSAVENLKIGLIVAIMGIGGGAYHYRGYVVRVDQHDETLKELRADRALTASVLASLDKNVALMAQRLEVIEKAMPAVHATRLDVREIKREVALLNVGPLMPYQPGPLTMMVRSQN